MQDEKGRINDIENIFHLYAGAVYWGCLEIVRNEQIALDLRQDVLLKVIKNYASFRGYSTLRTWIMQVAANRCTDYLRAQHRNIVFLGDDQSIKMSEPVSDYDADEVLVRADLQRFLGICSPDVREMMQLHFEEGYTHQEIAGLLGLHRNVVTRRIKAAVQKTLKQFAPQRPSIS